MIHDDDNEYSASARVMPREPRAFILAATLEEAITHAGVIGIQRWTYCDYVEKLTGLRECNVFLAPGWRNRSYIKNWLLHFKHRQFNLIAPEGDTTILEQLHVLPPEHFNRT